MKKPSKTVIRRSIYVIQNDVGMCKVGIAVKPETRLAELQTGSPHPLSIAYTIIHNDASGVEERAHKILARYRVHGEWFRCSPRVAEQAVNEAAESLGGVEGVGDVLYHAILPWLLGLLAVAAGVVAFEMFFMR